MVINNHHYRSIWLEDEQTTPKVCVINQLLLPFEFKIEKYSSYRDLIQAIKDMILRGAPLIGGAGAMAVFLAAVEFNSEILAGDLANFNQAILEIKEARPTAVNLSWATNEVVNWINNFKDHKDWLEQAKIKAIAIIDEDEQMSRKIGKYGLELIRAQYIEKKRTINILTHCNAGWLATIDYGTALAPIYAAFEDGIDIHVWVDETRPRNQGARLTAFELSQAGIKHTVITDNCGGHLMQHGMVDLCIVGCDRATSGGDAANKIGTYLKALAAKDNSIPFFVALPSSTFDWSIKDGLKEIMIEERESSEVSCTEGWYEGKIVQVESCNPTSPVKNYGFDVTPARLITAFITEMGITKAESDSLQILYNQLNKQ